jgi:ribose transport system permease protein
MTSAAAANLFAGGRFLVAPICLIAAVACFAVMLPGFMTASNAVNILIQMWVLALLAVGEAFPMVTRGFDISVGTVAALSGTVAAIATNAFGIGALPIALLIGLACGLVNGLVIGRFGVQPIVATLGMLIGARGVAFLITDGGLAVPMSSADTATWLAYEPVAGLPVAVWCAIIAVVIAAFILNRTVAGRRLVMLGSNPEAAWLVGIKPWHSSLIAYGLCGLFAGLAGLVMTLRAGTGLPTEGRGMELQAIAATIIGGVALSGGVARISTVVIGAAFVQVLFTGLNLLGISPFLAGVAVGIVIIGSGLLEYAIRHLLIPLSHKGRI